MTVTANRDSRVVVSNEGFSNPIPFDQYIEAAAHLTVYADATPLTIGTHYTVSGLLDNDGADITITATGLALDPDEWIVEHNPPIEQLADLSLGGSFGLAYENALDALVRRVQAAFEKSQRLITDITDIAASVAAAAASAVAAAASQTAAAASAVAAALSVDAAAAQATLAGTYKDAAQLAEEAADGYATTAGAHATTATNAVTAIGLLVTDAETAETNAAASAATAGAAATTALGAVSDVEDQVTVAAGHAGAAQAAAAAALVSEDNAAASAAAAEAAVSVAAVPGFIYGMIFGNGVDTTNDITCSGGFVTLTDTSGANPILVSMPAKSGLRLDANWATSGDDVGFRYSGAAIANATYHIFAACKAGGAAPTYYAYPTSASLATVLTALQAETGGADYVRIRRVWSIIRSGGSIIQFTQDGDICLMEGRTADWSFANNQAWGLQAVTVPLGLNLEPILSGFIQSTTANAFLQLGDYRDTDQDSVINAGFLSGGGKQAFAIKGGLFTNTSAQIYRQFSETTDASADLFTRGWIDTRGRFAA